MMNSDEPLESLPSRSTVHLEDALIFVCLATVWLPIAGFHGPVVSTVLLVSLGAMAWLLLRRKQRIDRLFAELRQRQQELEESGFVPGVPGLMPPERMKGPDPRPKAKAGRNGAHR